MVTGRTHEREGLLAGLRESRRRQRGADGAAGMVVDAGEIRRVGVDVVWLLYLLEQVRRVRE